jgi:hypothetical protein
MSPSLVMLNIQLVIRSEAEDWILKQVQDDALLGRQFRRTWKKKRDPRVHGGDGLSGPSMLVFAP